MCKTVHASCLMVHWSDVSEKRKVAQNLLEMLHRKFETYLTLRLGTQGDSMQVTLSLIGPAKNNLPATKPTLTSS